LFKTRFNGLSSIYIIHMQKAVCESKLTKYMLVKLFLVYTLLLNSLLAHYYFTYCVRQVLMLHIYLRFAYVTYHVYKK